MTNVQDCFREFLNTLQSSLLSKRDPKVSASDPRANDGMQRSPRTAGTSKSLPRKDTADTAMMYHQEMRNALGTNHLSGAIVALRMRTKRKHRRT